MKKTSDFDFMPDAVEVFERPPSPLGRAVLWTIFALVTVTIFWLIFSKVDIVVSAQGKIVPSGSVKVIQSVGDGIVRKINVRDGQMVKKGEVLMELDATNSLADLEKLEQDFLKSELEVRRLNAQLDNMLSFSPPEGVPEDLVVTQNSLLLSQAAEHVKKLELADNEIKRYAADYAATLNEIAKVEATLPILEKRLSDGKKHAEQGLIAGKDVTEMELKAIEMQKDLEIKTDRIKEVEANLSSAQSKLEVTKSEYESSLNEKLTEATHKRNSAKQEFIKAEQRNLYQIIKAPSDGFVQQLSINTEGGVVKAAESLLVIVPEGTDLEVDAKILNRDVGFVSENQNVFVKVDAYEFTRYGMLEGKVKWVGSDAINDEDLGPIYPVKILLSTKQTPNKVSGRNGVLTPGMSVVNDVVIGQRRLIEYFLGSLMRYKDESLRER